MGGGSKGGPNCEWVKDVKSKMPDFPDFPDFPFKFELPPMPALPGRVLPRGLLAASRPPADSGGIDLSELTAASISFGVGMLVVSLVGAVSLRRKGRCVSSPRTSPSFFGFVFCICHTPHVFLHITQICSRQARDAAHRGGAAVGGG